MFDDDVLELADPASRVPGRTKPSLRASTLIFVLALSLALTVGIGASLTRRPIDDSLRLGALPKALWSTRLDGDESIIALGGDLIVIQERRQGRGGAAVRGIDPPSGRVLWRHAVQGGIGPLHVRDLPGTGWIAIQVGDDVSVLDRVTGKQEYRFQLPDGGAGEPWVGSSDAGALLMAVPSYGSAGRVLTISRLSAPSPEAIVWSRDVTAPVGLRPAGAEVLEREGLLLVRGDDGARSHGRFSIALSSADGSQPDWSKEGNGFVVVRDVAVVAADSSLRAVRITSGRELWRHTLRGQVTATPSALLIGTDGRLRRLDPYTGRSQWETRLDSLPTGIVEWGGQVVFYQGAQTIFPDRGTTAADSAGSWVGALNVATGQVEWRTPTPSPVLDVLIGDDLAIARMYDPRSSDPAFEVAGIGREGRIAWHWRDVRDSWSLTRLGGHLATIDPEGTVTVWG